jgi:hypothetical protein
MSLENFESEQQNQSIEGQVFDESDEVAQEEVGSELEDTIMLVGSLLERSRSEGEENARYDRARQVMLDSLHLLSNKDEASLVRRLLEDGSLSALEKKMQIESAYEIFSGRRNFDE